MTRYIVQEYFWTGHMLPIWSKADVIYLVFILARKNLTSDEVSLQF